MGWRHRQFQDDSLTLRTSVTATRLACKQSQLKNSRTTGRNLPRKTGNSVRFPVYLKIQKGNYTAVKEPENELVNKNT